MTNTISPAASVISAVASTSSSSATTQTAKSLVKMANGEYTAASVAADPTDAAKLGLVKKKDGNYGAATSSQVTSSQVAPASPRSTPASADVLSALTTLTLGGS